MPPVAHSHSLKPTAEKPSDAAIAQDRPGIGQDSGRVLACASCRQPITTTTARIQVNGAHDHHFANPDGYAFHIGCFSRATGCAGYGAPSTEFTWFPGYAWQVVGCTRCRAHLGWRYRYNEHRFYGLILDSLAEEPEN